MSVNNWQTTVVLVVMVFLALLLVGAILMIFPSWLGWAIVATLVVGFGAWVVWNLLTHSSSCWITEWSNGSGGASRQYLRTSARDRK